MSTITAADIKIGDRIQTPRGPLTVRSIKTVRAMGPHPERVSMWFNESPNPWVVAAASTVEAAA